MLIGLSYVIRFLTRKMNKKFTILYEDDEVVVIEKPAGYHVHAPEKSPELVPESRIILQLLKKQVGAWLFPIHRLDVPTTGVLIYAKSSESARAWSERLAEQKTKKVYQAIVRGYTPDHGTIRIPLLSDSSGRLLEATTHYRNLRRIEFPIAIGKRHSTSRYSWLEIEIESGRFHQIRRHMNRISHPVIGDSEHGDTRHNQFFREVLNIPGLCLHAWRIHYWKAETEIILEAPFPQKWQRLEKLFKGEIIFGTDGKPREASKNQA